MSEKISSKSNIHQFLPALFPFLTWFPLLNRRTVLGDLNAGLTGAIIVLPQGVAYALIAGLPPEYGLYAAMVPTVIAALFGSSFHLISGPTVAMSIVVFETIRELVTPMTGDVTQQFIQLALTMTFLAGLFQLALGLARMGALVNFISHTVVVSFTAGVAILIATSQLKHVLGVEISSGESFLHTWAELFYALPAVNGYALGIALITLITAILFKKYLPRLPGMLVAMIVGGLTALLLDTQIHHIQMVPAIPATLPPLSAPDLSLSVVRQLAGGSLAVALLGLVEAVSISRAVATRSHQMIDGNREFVGQGLSNCWRVLFWLRDFRFFYAHRC
jgi:SulP family sulfate permease